MFDPAAVEPVVDLLAELAGDGRALELGIGTGRIALPLARRGVAVHGIDLSRAMVARLARSREATEIGVTIGDFATTTVDGTFSVAYLVFNTIMNLTTQAAQVACFRNVAAHLGARRRASSSRSACPELRRLPPGETVMPFHVSETRWGLDEYDVATRGACRTSRVRRRRRSPSSRSRSARVAARELDLMAQLAGMRLRERWSGWSREPFTSESELHVSVWETPATDEG